VSMSSARYGNFYCFFYSGSSPSIIALFILLGVSATKCSDVVYGSTHLFASRAQTRILLCYFSSASDSM